MMPKISVFLILFIVTLSPLHAEETFCEEVREQVELYAGINLSELVGVSLSTALSRIDETHKWTDRQKGFLKNAATDIMTKPKPTRSYAKELEEKYYQSCLETERRYEW